MVYGLLSIVSMDYGSDFSYSSLSLGPQKWVRPLWKRSDDICSVSIVYVYYLLNKFEERSL